MFSHLANRFAATARSTPTARTIPSARTMSLNSAAARLANKTVLITGASSGIGRATAFEFSRTSPDIRLILTVRRIDALRAVAAELAAESGGRTHVLPVQFDVSDAAAVRGFLAGLPPAWRDIDVLVNNAGLVKGVDHVGAIADADIAVMMSTNVLGLIGVRSAGRRRGAAR